MPAITPEDLEDLKRRLARLENRPTRAFLEAAIAHAMTLPMYSVEGAWHVHSPFPGHIDGAGVRIHIDAPRDSATFWLIAPNEKGRIQVTAGEWVTLHDFHGITAAGLWTLEVCGRDEIKAVRLRISNDVDTKFHAAALAEAD